MLGSLYISDLDQDNKSKKLKEIKEERRRIESEKEKAIQLASVDNHPNKEGRLGELEERREELRKAEEFLEEDLSD